MELFHSLGLCPDHLVHLNMLDIFFANFSENIWFIQKNKLFLSIIKNKCLEKVNIIKTSIFGY